MWASWDCYLTAARDILGLRLAPHEKYAAWEQADIHGGFRLMHKEFCMVSDFPERLLVDGRNRPHCEDGPSHRWRDGWSLYYWHGVKVPGWVIEHPERITPQLIDKENNIEVRRVMIDRFGRERYVTEFSDHPVVRDDWGQLYRKSRPSDTDLVLVRMVNSTPELDGTFKEYFERVPPECKTPREAFAWQVGKTDPNDYAPARES